jgi:hypothetical protein
MTRGTKWGQPEDGDIYIEFTVIGAFAKVTAIDAASGVEASITGPARANRSDLEKLAVRRLVQLVERRDKG